MGRDFRIYSLEYFFVETSHIVSSKRGSERNGLIEDTAERPNVRLAIVGLVTPHFWTCVVRGTCLSVKQSLLGNFTNVHIAKFRCSIFI